MEEGVGVRRKSARRPMDKFKGSIRGPLRFRASVPKKHQEGNRTLYPTITLNQREFNKTQDFPENAFFTTKYAILRADSKDRQEAEEGDPFLQIFELICGEAAILHWISIEKKCWLF